MAAAGEDGVLRILDASAALATVSTPETRRRTLAAVWPAHENAIFDVQWTAVRGWWGLLT